MKFLSSILVLIMLISCANNNQEMQSSDDYSIAMKFLKIGNYARSAELFEQIEDTKPFTKEATNGLIMSSYSYYKAKEYEDSIRVIEYFIQSNPINENIPYLYYLKGLNYYDRMTSMSRGRDIIENANLSFNELIYKYPNSDYAKDAQKKLIKIQTYLSGNELKVGDYYLKRKNYIGAINHYTKVLKDYPNSTFIPEVLYKLVKINLVLNLKSEASKYNELLNTNFSGTQWSKSSTNAILEYEKNNK